MLNISLFNPPTYLHITKQQEIYMSDIRIMLVEFRLIKSLYHRDQDEFIGRFDIPETPSIGECVNINGDPYIVHSKGWGLSDESTKIHCYIDLISP